MGAAKVAEELGKDRLRRVEEHYREKSEKAKENQHEKKKLVALQHEAELARTKANYETEKQSAIEEAVKLTMEKHNTEKQGLLEKYDTEKQTILAKHEAEIERSSMELNLTTKSLMTEIESAKRQTKALREEM